MNALKQDVYKRQMHDIGNVINRVGHAQSGAAMAFTLLNKLEMDPKEIGLIVSAIGNHDESAAAPVNPIAAALILSDKGDVRRTRVRNIETVGTDIPVSYTHLDVYKRQGYDGYGWPPW